MYDASVARQTATELVDIPHHGSFEPRNWNSNNSTILPGQLNTEVNAEFLDLDPDATTQRNMNLLWKFKLD